MGKFKSKTPKVKKIEDPSIAQRKADELASEERRRLAAGGRASTILTGPLGDTSEAPSVRNILLGGA